MGNDQPGQDVKAIWQNQSVEAPAMTMQLIRSKSRELQSKTRRAIFGSLAGPVASAFFFAFAAKAFPQLAGTLAPIFGLALAWSLVGLYFLNRGLWPAPMPSDAGLSTGLEFCREEIERRGQFLRRVLVWSFAPVMFSIATFVLALAMIAAHDRRLTWNGLPFLTLVIAWIVGYFVIRWREQRGLQRELDELASLQREQTRAL